MNAEALLLRLEGVKSRSQAQWSARCPAHDDKSPSLSIKEKPDGRILLHCFGGCAVVAVVDALGIQLEDLYPTPDNRAPLKPRALLTSSQALEILADEVRFVAVAAGNVAHGVILEDADRTRLLKASGRIDALREQIHL